MSWRHRGPMALRPRTALSWPLAKWVAGESEEAMHRTLSTRGPETRRKRKLLFLWICGCCWPLGQRRNRNNGNIRFSTRPSTGGRSDAVLVVSWERANSNISGLPASGPLRRFPGRLRARMGRGGRRTPARGSTRRPSCRFSTGRSSSGGHRRASTATSRRRPGPRGSRSCRSIPPWQDVLDHLGLLLHCRELLGKALDSVAEQPSLGDGGIEKACSVDVLHLCQVEPEMALLDHHSGHRLPEGPCRDIRRRAQLLHQPRVGTTLVHFFECLGLVNLQDRHGMQGRGCLARSTISFGCESMICWPSRGKNQQNHPGAGRDARCVRSKRSVGTSPAEKLLLWPSDLPERQPVVLCLSQRDQDGWRQRVPILSERKGEIAAMSCSYAHNRRMNHPRTQLQCAECPDTEDNRKRLQPRGHGRNSILKKTRSSVICSFRICSFSWSAQGNRWWKGLRWLHRDANQEQIKDERLCGDQRTSHPLGS